MSTALLLQQPICTNDDTNVTFTYTVSDGTDTVAGSATLDITPVNDAPQNLAINGNLLIPENNDANNIGSVVFTDADLNDKHQITVSDSRFELNNGTLALKPGITIDHETEDTVSLQIAVTDNAGDTVVHDFEILIVDVNEPPNTVMNIDSGTGVFSFNIPTNVFFDVDGDELNLSASLSDGSPLPPGIEFNPQTGEFTISEQNDVSGQTISVILTATDPGSLSTTSNVFDITIQPAFAAATSEFVQPQTPAINPDTALEETIDENTADDEEPQEDTDAPRSEAAFEAGSSTITADFDFDEQARNEVVQLTSSTQILSRVEAGNDINIGIKNHNQFQLISDSKSVDSSTKRTQQEVAAINTLSLKNLSEQADSSHSTLKDAELLSTTVLATSTTVTSSLSVGYILWLLRGGTLLASVMASLPAWRSIDPLPVLESLTGDSEDDTETLESMVESDNEESGQPQEPKE